MSTLYVAVIQPSDSPPVSRKFVGLPPELNEGRDERVRLPLADFVVVDRPDDGIGFFLLHYSADGALFADTWHKNLEDAKDQAIFEFGDILGEWQEAPNRPAAVALGIELVKRARRTSP